VKASADAVEQQHSKLCLKGLNLPGRGGLGEIEARRRAMNASGVDDGREGAQMAEIHLL